MFFRKPRNYPNHILIKLLQLPNHMSRKLELLSSPILKEHTMYMDSFLRQLLHIISRYLLFPFPIYL